MDISVVIPIYGCRAALEELHRRLTDTLVAMDKEYEIILVNDNCPQNSWEVIQQLCKKDKHVVGIELSRNFGQIQAITAGLDYSKGDWVVVMDCDLQDRPEEIPNLYKMLLSNRFYLHFPTYALPLPEFRHRMQELTTSWLSQSLAESILHFPCDLLY